MFTQILTSLWSVLKMLHEKNRRESLPVMEFHHPPNFPWILAAIPGSQNHHTGFTVLSGFTFYCFWDFVGLDFLRLPRSVINQLRHWHWRDVIIRCIFSLSNQNFAYCRCRRWGWRRWGRRMTLLFHRCPSSWWRSRGRTWLDWNHNKNEVLCIAHYPNPVFDGKWFFESIRKNTVRPKTPSELIPAARKIEFESCK